MEVKIRNIDRDIIDKLNESAASFGISREELLRKIIDQFINEQDLKKNPLTTIIKERKQYNTRRNKVSVDSFK